MLLTTIDITDDEHNPVEKLYAKLISRDKLVIVYGYTVSDEDGHSEQKTSEQEIEPRTILKLAQFLAEFSFCPDCLGPIHRSESDHICPEPIIKSDDINEDEIPF